MSDGKTKTGEGEGTDQAPADNSSVRRCMRPAKKGKRVLLAECNDFNRTVAKEILGNCGFIVETAADGSVVVKLVRENGLDYYDFILMAIVMPFMDGYEAAKEIRSEGYDGPIIALSTNIIEEDQPASLAAGMNACLTWPINVRELKRAISGTDPEKESRD